MSDGWTAPVMPLPPYGVAPGPLIDDESVLMAFARDLPEGHSEQLHVEGPALFVDGDIPAGLRLGPDVVLVRVDLPLEFDFVSQSLGSALASDGMACLDESSKLALPVALQVLGLRLSTWDLWGKDVDGAFAVLRDAAVGDQELPAHTLGGKNDVDDYPGR